MTRQTSSRLQKIYSQSKLKPPYDKLPLIKRYWIYQKERLPLIPLILMGVVSGSAIMKANDNFSLVYLLAGTTMVTAYLLQIRFADEPKDYEHDNKFYPNRPVQRGVITLGELLILRNVMIGIFFAVAILLQSWPVLLLACTQQLYSLLTRKEFFIRDWLRDHFLIYMFSHYFQLFILSWLSLTVLQVPEDKKLLYFGFALLSMAVVEVARKIQGTESNAAGDTYSAVLGTRKAVSYFVGFVVALATYTGWILFDINGNSSALLIAVAAVILAVYVAYQYFGKPNKNNAKAVQLAGVICYFLFSFTILVGA